MPTYNMDKDGLAYRFNKSRAKIQVYGGAFGNGKTAALSIKAIQVADDYPGANMLLARETFPKLNDTLRKEFYKWIPKSIVRRWPSKDDNTLYLHNGTTINFRYVAQRGKTAEDGQTTSNLLSATYDLIGIDQIEDPGIVEKDFFDLMGRLRGTTPYRGTANDMPPTGPRWLIVTCNPTSNWFYRRVIKPLHLYLAKGTVTEHLMYDRRRNMPIIELFEGSTYENIDNLPADFIEGIEDTFTGQMRDRFLLGKWASYEGLVYPNFKEELHMLPREFILTYLDKLRSAGRHKITALEGYDFGMAVPSCYLLSFVDEYGRVFVVDGFYKKEMSFEDQAREIRKIRAKYVGLIDIEAPICADPDLFRRKVMPGYKSLGTTIAQKYEGDYSIKMRPSDNSINSGIAKVSAYLNTYSNMPRLDKDSKSSLIYFCDELTFIPEEFGNYFWKKNPQGEEEDRPIDRNDHALDTIKYMLSFRPKPGDIIQVNRTKAPAWMFWHEVDENAIRERVF